MPDAETITPPAHLHGRALEVWEAGERRRRQEAERNAVAAANARLMTTLAGKLLNVPGPDAVRVLLGREDALRVLAASGADPVALAGNWEASSPVAQQSSTVREDFSGDPLHDSRIVNLVLAGASWDEINAARQAVTREYAERAAQRAARQPLPDLPPLPMGVAADPAGAPAQRSQDLSDWSDYPDHDPHVVDLILSGAGLGEIGRAAQEAAAGTPQRRQPAASVPGLPVPARPGTAQPGPRCDHAGQPGAFCMECGTRIG